MKLKALTIKGYKNLENISIDFSANRGTSLLVGNNGCGKSNILEAISSIFAGLYKDNFVKPRFDYKLNYEVNNREIDISLTKGRYSIKVDSKNISKSAYTKDGQNLPSNVISCYSGESARLWNNYYWPYYKDYIDNIKKASATPFLPLIYINKYSLDISLLTLFFHDFGIYTDIATFCNETLGIKTIRNVTFDFDANKIKEWETNSILNLVQAICGVDKIAKIPAQITLPLNDFKSNVLAIISSGKDLFTRLYGATMPKEDKIIKKVRIECVLKNGAIITVDDLSEGEKKSLLITTILEELADENSLILFDEPDSHIHISRKRELKDTLDRYQNKRESILTTHSPSLASAFDNGNHIIGLGTDTNNKTTIIDKSATNLISELTGGIWNINQQNIFLSSSKPVILLVEGKTDKEHFIQAYSNLKFDYPEIDFDVFSMNSSEHIREVLIGMSCSEIQWRNKYIGIFDNDEAGQRDIKSGFEKEDGIESVKHVKYKDGIPSNKFYAFLLPKPETFNLKEDFTIENCYPAVRYQDAFEQALNEKKGHFGNLSIDKIADDLKNKSKTILASNAKGFPKRDFDGFRPIFDLIKEIKKL